MKKLISLSLLALSFSTLGSTKFYKCTSKGEVGGIYITEASITFTGSAKSIKGANLVAVNDGSYLLNTDFRAPRIVNGQMRLDGKDNSRINPFGDVESIDIKDLNEKVGLDELPYSLEVSYESLKGPVGNRGGDAFELKCFGQDLN